MKCPICDGSGLLNDGHTPCDYCDGYGEAYVETIIKNLADSLVRLSRKNSQLRATVLHLGNRIDHLEKV